MSLDRALEKGLIPEDVKNILEEAKLPEFRFVIAQLEVEYR